MENIPIVSYIFVEYVMYLPVNRTNFVAIKKKLTVKQKRRNLSFEYVYEQRGDDEVRACA